MTRSSTAKIAFIPRRRRRGSPSRRRRAARAASSPAAARSATGRSTYGRSSPVSPGPPSSVRSAGSGRGQHSDVRVQAPGRVESTLDPVVQLGDRGIGRGVPAPAVSGARSRRRSRRRTSRPARLAASGVRPADRPSSSVGEAGRAGGPVESDARACCSTSGARLRATPRSVAPSHNTESAGTASRNSPGIAVAANHCSKRRRGRVRRITSPMNPSVPREPTSSRHRSNPLTFFTVGPPALTTLPAALT